MLESPQMNSKAEASRVDRVVVTHPEIDLWFNVLRFYDVDSLLAHFCKLGVPAENLNRGLTGFTAQNPACRNEIHVAAVHSDDPREDVRRWAHEIAHAGTFALDSFLEMKPDMREELPSLCAELLADTVLLLTQGKLPDTKPESGLLALLSGK